jgi:hypothetical protein
MTKILFRYTVESDGENLRIKSEIGDNLDPAEALLVGLFRWHAKKAERTVLAVADGVDDIILA